MSRPTSRTWAYTLGVLQTIRDDGTMTVETRDLHRLRDALGEEVLCGLLRLFVWVDRISGLMRFGYWNGFAWRQQCLKRRPIDSMNCWKTRAGA